MQLSSGRLQLAATDLGRFLSCRYLTALDLEVAQGMRKKPPLYPDLFLKLLQERGVAHEKQYTEKVEASGSIVLDLSELKGPPCVSRCLAAMKGGQPAIAQGALAANGWYGVPDLLLKVDRPSRLGPWSYEAYDTKLARETRGTTILQLCFYSELLGAVQEAPPEFFYVVTPATVDKPETYRLADFAAYYRLVKRHLEEAAAQDPSLLAAANYPEPIDSCDFCRWGQACNVKRHADDHLSLVAGITRLQRKELEAGDVKTLERLGDLGLPLPFRPARGSKESFEKAQRQARIQLAGRRANAPVRELLRPVEAGRGLARLPEPSPGDVFLDLEGDHFADEGGREYLFGMTVLGPRGKTRHVKRWAHTAAEEKAAFEATLDEILGLWAAHPGMHVYHYAAYEPGAFKRLMGRHATHERDVDRLLRAGRFVDLCAVVKQGLVASVESYSIKKLECFYGFAREAPLREAGDARRAVEFVLETGDRAALTAEVRTLVEDYNEEDCVSALRLRDWLETLRVELLKDGEEIPRPEEKDGSASEEAEKRSEEVQRAMDALLAGVPPEKADRNAEQQARWLLAHMLEFHHREDKVTWWEFFRLRDMTDEDEPLDERAVLTGLKLLKSTPPKGREKCPTDRYTFSPQEFEGRKKDELYTSDGKPLGTIVDVDRGKCWIDVKKRMNRVGDHPSWAFVHSHISSKVISDSLMRLAADVIAHGVAGAKHTSAARELLLRRAPRLSKGALVQETGEDVVAFAKRAVLTLDRSILPIQGPPGAGKTFTGGRMIVECVDKGLKVGVSAVSHKVILKLLEEAVDAAKKAGRALRCVHKNNGDQSICPEIEEVATPKAAIDALHDESVDVVSGTAWLWSNEDAANSVDVLFVDEAGQASLANVLAMAQAAENLVLLGDPQQLQQPQRGTHPEGVDASALEHLLAGNKTIPKGHGIFLDKTWRLPPAICAFTSELFYEGRLESRREQEMQKLSGAPPYEGAGLWFVPVEHDGNTTSSPEEVTAVEAVVKTLLRKGSRWMNDKGETMQVTKDDILVVAPFNAQVNRLQETLETRGISVGTVDRFQGQQAAVVIYSMATSRPEDAPRGMEFLYDLNRLNVATSRARCACFLVASPRLLEPECKTPRQMTLANAMCRYMELSEG